MDYRLWSMIDILSETEYKTSNVIGGALGLSEKTIRTRMQDLSRALEGNGAELISKPRYGYWLKITEPERWAAFKTARHETAATVPGDSNERVEYILASFLSRNDYMKLEILADFLYVSVKTLANEIKRVEYILSHFHIGLERKPHHGIRAVGNEFDKRCCILQNFYLSPKSFWGMQQKQEQETEKIAAVFLALSKEQQIKFTEATFQTTVLYISLSISRMRKELYITMEPELKAADEIRRERMIAEKIYQTMGINDVPELEIYYTAIYIAGKRILNEENNYQTNVIASEELDQLISKILEEIYLTYQVDLRNDLNLRIMLVQHLKPMEIRLKYGIPVEAAVGETKERYILAHNMSQLAATILSSYYKKNIPDDEVSCLTMYFALALEEKRVAEKRKNNILLVCVSGKASSRMLIYRFQKEFNEYINTLQVCGMYEFDSMDLSNIDFIFTTVPIYKKVSVPIMEIHDFLESNDIMKVRHFFQIGDLNFLNKFYHRKLFFADVPGETKEEVIHAICSNMRKVAELPKGFEESVLQRENFGPTDFGNLTAIPHPCRVMTKETLVAVAVLQHEIKWSVNPVRIVILTSLKEERDEETQKFYEVTANFLSDKEAVQTLIQNPAFNTFEKMITALKR